LLGNRFHTQKFDLIATSPLTRAVQTTELILKSHSNPQLGTKVEYIKELEEMDYGDFEGKQFTPNKPGKTSMNLVSNLQRFSIFRIEESYG
jgi:broad specificity phosphatase PhoE